MAEYKIAVFVSGRGSNLQALIRSSHEFRTFTVDTVFANDCNIGAVEVAKEHCIDTIIISKKGGDGTVNFSECVEILISRKVDLVVLAGYVKLIPASFVHTFKNRIINIHPGLLPFFGGKEMYGMNVHKAVFATGMKVSGATVHFVNEEYDKGSIIAQRTVDISNVKSPEEIAQLVLAEEHKILTKVVCALALGMVKVIDNRVYILN